MFTGIIEALGTVKGLKRQGLDGILEIETAMGLDDVALGDSIAVSGVCLTVTGKNVRGFRADVSGETLSRTTLDDMAAGNLVNLEKALRLNSFLGGHFVLGHVDGTARIREKQPAPTPSFSASKRRRVFPGTSWKKAPSRWTASASP